MIYLVKATQFALMDGLMDLEAPRWSQTTPRTIVAKYDLGPALITGPIVFGTPINEWQEVCCHESVLPELESRATVVMLMKDQVRNAKPLRDWLKASGRPVIRNGAGNAIAPRPERVISGRGGRNGIAEMLGDEDPELAPELPDLE